MIIERFLTWVESARASERMAAASALARAYLQSDLTIDERCAAEAALTVLLDDPSPQVRLALAEALSISSCAPLHLITSLSADQPEVAAMVLLHSPLLSDGDLIDRIALGAAEIQCAIAMRSQLSGAVCAAMSEVGCLLANKLLLENTGAKIAKLSLRRLVERFGHHADMRELLLADQRLPAEARHALVVKVSEALCEMPMVKALIGPERASRIAKDACIRACLTLVDECEPSEHPALVEHLRLSGALTTAFVLRTLIFGKIGFFVSIIAALSGQDEPRIKAQLNGGRAAVLSALYVKCGFTSAVAAFLINGVQCWRLVANGKLQAGPQEIARMLLEQIGADKPVAPHAHGNDDLVSLVRSIYLETVRENGRKHAQSLVAA